MTYTNDFDDEYAESFRSVFNYMKRVSSDQETAAELTQEVFLKLHRSWDEHRAEAWLWTIARNTAIDYFRSTGRRIASIATTHIDSLPNPAPNVEMLMVRRERRRKLVRAIRALPRRQRRVLWLLVGRQLSYSEIEVRLGLTNTALRTLISRARRTLDLKKRGPSP